jgi:preprotein translocase subunit SecA
MRQQQVQAKRMRAAQEAQASSKEAAPNPTEAAPAEASGFEGVGRNDPCPCGSGKKFKKCHGKAEA